MPKDPLKFARPIVRPALSENNRRVLQAIIWYRGEHKKSPTTGELAALLKCSRTAIVWHEAKLKDAGLITVDAPAGPVRRKIEVRQ